MTPFRTTRRVQFRDTDAAQIAHFSAFFNYMEEVEHDFLRQRGLSVFMHDAEGNLSWPRVAASCQYTGAIRFEDVLDIELTIARLGQKSISYAFRFSHEGRDVATGEMTAVCCRLSPDSPPRGVAIPDEVRARLTTSELPPPAASTP